MYIIQQCSNQERTRHIHFPRGLTGFRQNFKWWKKNTMPASQFFFLLVTHNGSTIFIAVGGENNFLWRDAASQHHQTGSSVDWATPPPPRQTHCVLNAECLKRSCGGNDCLGQFIYRREKCQEITSNKRFHSPKFVLKCIFNFNLYYHYMYPKRSTKVTCLNSQSIYWTVSFLNESITLIWWVDVAATQSEI